MRTARRERELQKQHQNRCGLQRALRGVTEGLAEQTPDSEYIRSLAMYRSVLCVALGLPQEPASHLPQPASSLRDDEPWSAG